MNATQTELQKFFARTEEDSNGCILWQGPLDRDGYGTAFFRRLNRRVHRLAWYFVHGSIPEGMVINHTCRNRNCVNHQHLQCVTVRENALKDSSSRGYLNSQKTHCKDGHPYDRNYGGVRYCSICQAAKTKRLRAKWKAEDTVKA